MGGSKPQKQVIFTFDYELFLGKDSGTVENCMIIPTNKTLQIFENYGIRGVFFVDTTYLIRLSEIAQKHPRAKEDFGKIKHQLQGLIQNGHDVFPHIHPHWLDAEYNPQTNRWKLENLSKYRFNSLSEPEKTFVFDESMRILNEIISPQNPEYQINGYRAGGWCIQPFSDFEPHFKRHGIKYEFSVLPGFRKNSNAIQVDFSGVKMGSKPYQFNQNESNPEKSGQFTQIPISSIPLDKSSLFRSLTLKILWRIKHGQNFGDGEGVQFKDLDNVKNEYDLQSEMASLENLNISNLNKYRAAIEQNDYFQFISHPKMISPHNLFILNRLLKNVSARFEIESDWRKGILITT